MGWNKGQVRCLLPVLVLLGLCIPVELATYQQLKSHIGKSKLQCIMCNSAVDASCNLKKPVDCKSTYFENYGTYDDALDLKKFPTLGNMTWKMNSANATSPEDATNIKTSGYDILYEAKETANGFTSCVKQRIVVSDQINGGQKFGIPVDNPRILRFCGFGKTGCKTYKNSESEVTICHCNKNGCNASSIMRVSHWIFAAFLMIIGAQIAVMK